MIERSKRRLCRCCKFVCERHSKDAAFASYDNTDSSRWVMMGNAQLWKHWQHTDTSFNAEQIATRTYSHCISSAVMERRLTITCRKITCCFWLYNVFCSTYEVPLFFSPHRSSSFLLSYTSRLCLPFLSASASSFFYPFPLFPILLLPRAYPLNTAREYGSPTGSTQCSADI